MWSIKMAAEKGYLGYIHIGEANRKFQQERGKQISTGKQFAEVLKNNRL